MKKFTKILFVALAATVMAACGGGNAIDSAIDSIDKAMEKVEKNKTSMTKEDWQRFSEETEASFKVLDEALKSENVSALKKLKISAVVLKYVAVAGEAALHTAADELGRHLEESHLADSVAKIGTALGVEQQSINDALEEAAKQLTIDN